MSPVLQPTGSAHAGRLVVTGATGFVGRVLCREARRAGWHVVATARSANPVPDAHETVRIASLGDAGALKRACAGADVLVHLAARVHVMRETAADPDNAFREINVRGTASVLAAARNAGVRHVTYVSSIKVNGEGGARPYTHLDRPAPLDAYGRSKLEAEQLVRAEHELTWTIVRPTLVYGPGVGGNFQRLLRLARLSRVIPLPLGDALAPRSMISVRNLADLLLATIACDATLGRVVLAADAEDLSVAMLLREFGEALGFQARLLNLPTSLMRMAMSAIGKGAEAARMFEPLTVDRTDLMTRVGWTPPQTVREAVHETARWWADRGRAP